MTETTNLNEAYTKWASYAQEPCFCARHSNARFMEDGFLITPRPDDEVCEREKSWRRYVELRDGKAHGWASAPRLRKYHRTLE